MEKLTLNIDVQPDIILSLNQNITEFGKQLKLWAAISLFQFGKLSLARAANLAGYHRYDFENILADLNIPISNITIDDVKKELEYLKNL